MYYKFWNINSIILNNSITISQQPANEKFEEVHDSGFEPVTLTASWRSTPPLYLGLTHPAIHRWYMLIISLGFLSKLDATRFQLNFSLLLHCTVFIVYELRNWYNPLQRDHRFFYFLPHKMLLSVNLWTILSSSHNFLYSVYHPQRILLDFPSVTSLASCHF